MKLILVSSWLVAATSQSSVPLNELSIGIISLTPGKSAITLSAVMLAIFRSKPADMSFLDRVE